MVVLYAKVFLSILAYISMLVIIINIIFFIIVECFSLWWAQSFS